MGFTNQERINLNSKVLAASVIDANEAAQWYESRLLNQFVLGGDKVWTEIETLRQYPAANKTTAQSNALAAPDIIEDLSADVDAIRLTPVPGSPGTFIALATYNDFTSTRLEDWIQPQAVPQSTGAASIGYTIELYDGQPGAGGTLVNPTDGTTGTGATKSVGWVFNYANGLLLLSADFRSSISNPWVKGFRYIGDTALTGLVKPLPEQDGYVAIANNQNLVYLAGYEIGDALIWDGFSWVASRNTCSDYLIQDGYVTEDSDVHTVDLFTPEANTTYQVELRVQAENFTTGDINSWSLISSFQNGATGVRQIGTTQSHLEAIENNNWTVDFATDGYVVQAEFQDGYYDGYSVNWTFVGYYQAMDEIAVQGCGNIIIRGVQAVEMIAGIQTTTQTTPVRVGGCVFDSSDKRQVEWKSVLETTNVSNSARLELFDVINGEIISTVESTSLSAEVVSVNLVIPDQLPSAAEGIYEARLYMGAGSSPDSVTCLYSAINDNSGSLGTGTGTTIISVPKSLQGVAGAYNVDVLAPTRIGGLPFSGAGFATVVFRAILQTSNASAPATLELYNANTGLVVSTLTSTSLNPEIQTETLTVPSDLPLAETPYEIRLRKGAIGTPSDFVSCTYAAFEIEDV